MKLKWLVCDRRQEVKKTKPREKRKAAQKLRYSYLGNQGKKGNPVGYHLIITQV